MKALDLYSLKKSVGNALFMLFILILTLDPTGSILHLKNLSFVLLVAYNMVCFRPDYRKLPIVIISFSVVIISWIFATIQDVYVNLYGVIALLKAVSPMLLLLWVREYDLLALARVPIVVGSLVIVFLFWLVVLVPVAEGVVYHFFNTASDDTVIMSWRSFLGIELFGMYYKSLASFILVFAVYVADFFNKEKRNWKTVCGTILIFHAFVISGTRSTMLLPFVLIGFNVYREYKNTRYFKYILYPAIIFIGIAFLVLLYMLISEKNEASNLVKYAHLYSYWELFSEHPIYLLLGQGPGTSFYSAGFGRVTSVTEWTYLELIRNFGMCSLVIIYVFYRPLVDLWKERKNSHTNSLLWGYLIYLFVAGTNPLMLSSTGMIVLLIIYSYVERIRR